MFAFVFLFVHGILLWFIYCFFCNGKTKEITKASLWIFMGVLRIFKAF